MSDACAIIATSQSVEDARLHEPSLADADLLGRAADHHAARIACGASTRASADAASRLAGPERLWPQA